MPGRERRCRSRSYRNKRSHLNFLRRPEFLLKGLALKFVRIGRTATLSHCLLLLFVVLLGSCASPEFSHHAPAVVKSDNDSRSYRYLTLPNQLRVLLISDPGTDKAAASLDVNVGSGADPGEYQGLAHFLEHMLFLGTEKYPDAGEYQAFISAHGGDHNAFTSFEHTNYFFDIDPQYLEPTLDRFAQFFIAPLFNSEYVDREKNAVNSEYMAKIKDDQRRMLDVFKTVINPQHPFAKFSVGNLQTLSEEGKDTSLREQLMQLHDTWYSANIMTLVVLGKESLDDLQTIVAGRFAAIPNKRVALEPVPQPLFAPSSSPLPRLVKVKPEKNIRTLSLLFPTADETLYYRQKPLYYISNILGHEGEGSLFSLLKSRGWVEQLSAGEGLGYRGGTTFNVSIRLTPEGEHHVDEIVTEVFQTLRRIRDTGNQEWLYDEQRRLAEQSFRYQEIATPSHYVTALANGMHYYRPEDTLRGTYLMEGLDRALLDQFLDAMTPGNCLLTLSTPSVQGSKHSPYYQTPYEVEAIDPDQLARWQAVPVNPDIQFPSPNPFIADRLALKSAAFNQREKQLYAADNPAQLENGQGLRLWYKPERQFELPKASIFIGLRSAAVSGDARSSALLSMLAQLTMDQLNELSYPATLAGLNYQVSAGLQGLSISVNGFDDKQPLLLREILSVLQQAAFSQQRFDNLRRDTVRDLENRIKDQPYHRAFEQLSDTLYLQKPTTGQLLQAFRAIDFTELMAFHQRFLQSTAVDMLVHGNYRLQEATKIAAEVRRLLVNTPAEIAPLQVLRRPAGDFNAVSFASDYSDSVLLLYTQGADMSKETRAAMGLSAQIMKPGFYTTLRTEKQLGYIVISGAYPVRDVPGVFFLVQSPVADTAKLQAEMLDYLSAVTATVDDMSQEEFERQRDALVLRIAEAPKNLFEQSLQYWDQIDQDYLDFDLKQQLVSALNELTLERWRTLFKQSFAPINNALWIYATQSPDGATPSNASSIEDLPAWKQAQPGWQMP